MEIKLYSPYAESGDEIVHPSILRMPGGQFKYCVAYTPYPNSNYLSGNPCITYTDDFKSFHYFGINPVVSSRP